MMVLIVIVQADDHSPLHPSSSPPRHDLSPSDNAGIMVRSKLICPPKCLLKGLMKARRKKNQESPHEKHPYQHYLNMFYTFCMLECEHSQDNP
jgi:hypothetical protein